MESQAYCFNYIFNVNFKTPQAYAEMDRKAKYKQLKNVFRNFCQIVSIFFMIYFLAGDSDLS